MLFDSSSTIDVCRGGLLPVFVLPDYAPSRCLTPDEAEAVRDQTVAALRFLYPRKTVRLAEGRSDYRYPYPFTLNAPPAKPFVLTSRHSLAHADGWTVDFTFTLNYTFDRGKWHQHVAVLDEAGRSAALEIVTWVPETDDATVQLLVDTLTPWQTANGLVALTADDQEHILGRIEAALLALRPERQPVGVNAPLWPQWRRVYAE